MPGALDTDSAYRKVSGRNKMNRVLRPMMTIWVREDPTTSAIRFRLSLFAESLLPQSISLFKCDSLLQLQGGWLF
jgi:hypothetical protein